MKRLVALAFWAAAAAAPAAPVPTPDHAEIERTPIVGNRELPRVLVIVPWRKPLPGVPAGRPMLSVLDEAPAALDRAVFLRQIANTPASTDSTPARRAAPVPAPTPEKQP